jgi:hypothetical protein
MFIWFLSLYIDELHPVSSVQVDGIQNIGISSAVGITELCVLYYVVDVESEK